jgi:hypothetical protein
MLARRLAASAPRAIARPAAPRPLARSFAGGGHGHGAAPKAATPKAPLPPNASLQQKLEHAFADKKHPDYTGIEAIVRYYAPHNYQVSGARRSISRCRTQRTRARLQRSCSSPTVVGAWHVSVRMCGCGSGRRGSRVAEPAERLRSETGCCRREHCWPKRACHMAQLVLAVMCDVPVCCQCACGLWSAGQVPDDVPTARKRPCSHTPGRPGVDGVGSTFS